MSHVELIAGRATDVLARPLTHSQAAQITGVLHMADIPVLVSVDRGGVVQLWPERALTTVELVHAYRAIAAVTDSRIGSHERRPV